jgi:hypothetical protein
VRLAISAASMKSAVYYWVHATERIHLQVDVLFGFVEKSPPESLTLLSDSVHECIMESDEREYILSLTLHVLDALFGHLLNDRVPELVDDGRRSKRTLPI